MRKIDADLVTEAQRYVVALLKNWLSAEYVFHSIEHTLEVAENAVLIGKNSGLNQKEIFMAQVSALFHDTGYIRSYENHEEESAFIAGEFLRLREIEERYILMVTHAILATKVPQAPNNQIAAVLCDADLHHLTSDNYFEKMELLRLEWQICGKQNFTEKEFHLNSIEFFRQHHYHSEYGKTIMEAKKQQVLTRVRDRVHQYSL